MSRRMARNPDLESSTVEDSVAGWLRTRGVKRRDFLKFCTTVASALALAPSEAARVATVLSQARRPSVIWLSFQTCGGCAASLLRSHAPTLESLMLEAMTLSVQPLHDPHAETAHQRALTANRGRYLCLVEGSVPAHGPGYANIAGRSSLDILRESAQDAAAVIAVGSCAAFGGIPAARPNPTAAGSVSDALPGTPVINLSGCPPIPVVIASILVHRLTSQRALKLDAHGRPELFYGRTIHERCYRLRYFQTGRYARRFDDEGARKGWCLYRLGCRGPVTYNACPTTKWNESVSYPIDAGHPCLGCAEPGFWDKGGFYDPISRSRGISGAQIGAATVAGATAGIVGSALGRRKRGHTHDREPK